MMETALKAFFARYESLFNQALDGDVDMEEVASLYAAEFIASSPAGVMAAKNDAAFRQVMAQGYAHYRAIGTKAMRLRDVRLSSIDADHWLVHVGWAATYARKDGPDVAIEFDVHYFVRTLDGRPEVFGWVSGDEDALLRQHGII